MFQMPGGFDQDQELDKLKSFVSMCRKNPSILNAPQLSFVKEFVEELGGKIPSPPSRGTTGAKTDNEPSKPEVQSEPESEDSDIELDMTGVIEPDNDPPQEMGDLSVEPTEEQMNESQEKRSEAMAAYSEQDYQKAVDLYTEAIQMNPQAALLYAKRGQVFLALKKPNACIRDCDRAIELNPDSAAAFKFRGRANQLIGKFEEAASDLRLACKLDFDDQVNLWLAEVTPNARKIEEHNRKKERTAEEKLEKQKRERIRKVREAQAQAAQAQKEQTSAQDSAGDGGRDFSDFRSDPEFLQATQDPEVMAALKDIMSNPANLLKYQNNPKIMALIGKAQSKFGGGGGGFPDMMGGMGGMGMGGMGGFPSGMGGFPSDVPKPPSHPHDDVGLD